MFIFGIVASKYIDVTGIKKVDFGKCLGIGLYTDDYSTISGCLNLHKNVPSQAYSANDLYDNLKNQRIKVTGEKIKTAKLPEGNQIVELFEFYLKLALYDKNIQDEFIVKMMTFENDFEKLFIHVFSYVLTKQNRKEKLYIDTKNIDYFNPIFDMNIILIRLRKIKDLYTNFDLYDTSLIDMIIEKLDINSAIPNKSSTEGFNDRIINMLSNKYNEVEFRSVRTVFDNKNLNINNLFIDIVIIDDKYVDEKETELDNIYQRENYSSLFENLYRTKKAVNLNELFCTTNNDIINNIVYGRAGVGKTTLAKYMCIKWKEDRCWSDIFKFPIYIELRNIKEFNSLEETVIDLYHINDEEIANLDVKLIISFLEKNKENILYILDGFDELDKWNQKKLVNLLNKYPKWILTTRPYGFNKADIVHANKSFENIGFDNISMKKYVKNYFELNTNKGSKLIMYLDKNTNIKAISHIPIILEMICGLWNDSENNISANMSITQLYNNIIECLSTNYLNRKHDNDNKEIDSKKYKIYLVLGCLSYYGLIENTIIFSMKNFDDIVINLETNIIQEPIDVFFEKYIKRIGLLKEIRKGDNYRQSNYYFQHLTFQEFFSAKYISSLCDENFLEFIITNKYESKFQMVIMFISGNINCIERADLLFRGLFENEKDICGLFILQLATLCYSELKNFDNFYYKNILDNYISSWILYAREIYADDMYLSNKIICNIFEKLYAKKNFSQRLNKMLLNFIYEDVSSDNFNFGINLIQILNISNNEFINRMLYLLKNVNVINDNTYIVNVVNAIINIGKYDNKIIIQLKKILNDSNRLTRLYVAKILINIDSDTNSYYDIFMEILNSNDVSFVIYTLNIIGSIGQCSKEILNKIKQLISIDNTKIVLATLNTVDKLDKIDVEVFELVNKLTLSNVYLIEKKASEILENLINNGYDKSFFYSKQIIDKHDAFISNQEELIVQELHSGENIRIAVACKKIVNNRMYSQNITNEILLLMESDSTKRRSAILVLSSLMFIDDEIYEYVVKLLSDQDEDVTIKSVICDYLYKNIEIVPNDIIKILISNLEIKDFTLSKKIVHILSKLNAIDLLINIIQNNKIFIKYVINDIQLNELINYVSKVGISSDVILELIYKKSLIIASPIYIDQRLNQISFYDNGIKHDIKLYNDDFTKILEYYEMMNSRRNELMV